MRLPTLTREIAWAAAWDAANANMRKHGRKRWNEEDYNVGWREFDRLWPPELDGWPKESETT